MIQSALLSQVKKWKKSGPLAYCLGADVGGSGVRIRLSNFLRPNQFVDHPHVKATSAQAFYSVFEHLDKALQSLSPGATCKASAFAIAGLRKGDSICVMNWPAPNEARTVPLDKIPRAVNRPHHAVLLNDLEACAYGVISSYESGTWREYFEQLCGPEGAPVISSGHSAILAMGSGLGGALVVRDFKEKKPIVVSTEIGWCLSTGVGPNHRDYIENRGLLEMGSNIGYQGRWAPIYEDMASGHGLVMDYEFLLGRKCNMHGGQIVELAKKGDATARKAVEMHYIYFTRCAKMLALSMKCDSIVMALSNQVTNRSIVAEMRDKMWEELNDCARPEWTKTKSIFGQKKDCNFNLLGTDYMAHRIAHSSV